MSWTKNDASHVEEVPTTEEGWARLAERQLRVPQEGCITVAVGKIRQLFHRHFTPNVVWDAQEVEKAKEVLREAAQELWEKDNIEVVGDGEVQKGRNTCLSALQLVLRLEIRTANGWRRARITPMSS